MFDFIRKLFSDKNESARTNIRIYISYRRSDSADPTGRLSDWLVRHFGPENIFKDTDSVPLGSDFAATLDAEIAQCDVVIAVIGPDWLNVRDSEGQRRLDNPDDLIRIELESALSRLIPIVPVLVSGAPMPNYDELPASLQKLAYRNAAEIRPDPDFSRDVDRLIRAIERLAGRVQSEPLPEFAGHPTKSLPIPEIDNLTQTTPTVFISHSTQDRKWVEDNIVGLVRSNGLNPWYAQTSILSATQWEREILKGLESSDWFLLVVSPRAATSEWVKDELNWAIYHRPTRIVPVLMEQADLWSFHIRLPRIQYVDFTTDNSVARDQLVKRLREPESTAN